MDIGIPAEVIENQEFAYELIDDSILSLLPERSRDGHKMSFGRVLVIAGSSQMAGAGILSVKAAYRAGTGLIEVITHSKGLTSMLTHVPEAIIKNLRE